MSLNWNIGKCERYEELHIPQSEMEWRGSNYYFPEAADDDRRNSHRITQHLVFMLMTIGMSSITEKNLNEVNRRIKVIEAALPGELVDLWFDDEMVETGIDMGMLSRRIGMSTNVTRQTKAQFADALVRMTAE